MKSPVYRQLYFQVLVGIVIGVFLGHFYPEVAISMKPLGDVFIKLIKMIIAPLIFCTVVVGIAKMGNMKEVGRVGFKSLVYFEIVSTIALIIGLLVVNLYQPGSGINFIFKTPEINNVPTHTSAVQSLNTIEFLLNVIPNSVVNAFVQGHALQVLLFSVLFGISLSKFYNKRKLITNLVEQCSHVLFGIVNLIIKLAPLGALGSIAFSISKYGFSTLLPLSKLIISVCITCLLFIFLVLGPILYTTGLSLWKFLLYIKEEIFIVFGTSSSETALPRIIVKLENMGCDKRIVGLVIPTGYSFNLDGTSIYLAMATVFLAQSINVDLSFTQQIFLLGIIMLTSKGAAAVPGGGFVTLASVISIFDIIPISGLTLLFGVDLFMSTIRSVTNLIGNGIATIIISRWERALDMNKANLVLKQENKPATTVLIIDSSCTTK